MRNNSETLKLNTSDVAVAGCFAAVMAVCSWISVPAAIPFTMQTFGVFLTIGLLGGKLGSISIAIYLLLGMMGLPVFSGFSGGLGHILGVTGGYIAGFFFSALVMWAMEHYFGNSFRILTVSMFLGLITCYAFGTAWFMLVYTKNSGPIGLTAALSMCVLPYIIPDIVKILMASFLCRRLRPIMGSVRH